MTGCVFINYAAMRNSASIFDSSGSVVGLPWRLCAWVVDSGGNVGGLSCGLCGWSIADAVWVVHCSGRFGGQYWWQFGGPL